MSAGPLESVLRTFRRQLAVAKVVRVGVIIVAAIVFVWAAVQPESESRWALGLMIAAVLAMWLNMLISAARLTRDLQAGTALLATGQLDDAEYWLKRAVTRFSMTAHTKLQAGVELATVLFRRDRHVDVVSVCREVLRHRVSRVRNVWIGARILLADSLLRLNEIDAAYEAMRPVYETRLSLTDRMKLLPVQLRYELAADHSSASVSALAEKVQIAELLDASQAALVHALLAEACRRESMPAQQAFLVNRARLYHDLEPLVAKHAVIAPILAHKGQQPTLSDDEPSNA
jgi:hypothetical protein